jgi:hypothetical protein
MNVSFDEFAELLKHSDDINDTEIRVTSGPQEAVDHSLHITTNLVLTFDPLVDLTCRNIVITGCEVEIRDLSLLGTISARNSTVRLTNCRLHHPPAACDYLLDVADHSKVSMVETSFCHTARFGLCADDHSALILERCSVSHVWLFAVAVTGNSFCECANCIMTDCGHDMIYLDSYSSVSLSRSSIKRSARLGIAAGLNCSVKLDECTVEGCQSGCISAVHSERVFVSRCHMLDTPHSSLLLEHTTAMIRHTIICNCRGNAINANRGAKIFVSHCALRNTIYPPLAICDGTLGYIKKCTISDCEMSGIIVRNRSKAAIKKCTIENVKQNGIVVSDSKDVTVTSSFVFNCTEAAVACYNHSEIHLRSSFLIGPSKTGINVFTGGFVSGVDTTIAGMRDACVWLHHGGSAKLVSTLMHPVVCDSRDEIVEQIRSIPLAEYKVEVLDEQLFRIETGRPLTATGCYIVGRGIIDIARNELEPQAGMGQAAVPARCKLCGIAALDCFFAFCGHSLYCRSCWDDLAEKPTRCELCFMPIEKVAGPIDCSHDEPKTCGICLSEMTDAIVVPCGHLICSECGKSWFEQHFDCPYCREAYAKARPFVSYA